MDGSVVTDPQPESMRVPRSGAPLELDLVVPPSGNMWLRRQQFWLGPGRAGPVVRFWIDSEWVHLSIGGQRIKSLRSRFSVADLDVLAARGAVPAGPPPVASHGGPGSRSSRKVFEVERRRCHVVCVNTSMEVSTDDGCCGITTCDAGSVGAGV